MALLAGLALTLVSVAPQDPPDLSVLSTADVRSLNRRVQQWFELWLDKDMAEGTAARRRASQRYSKAREDFITDWERKARGAGVDDLLKYVTDLQAVFDKAFPYGRQSTSGEIKRVTPRPPAHDSRCPARGGGGECNCPAAGERVSPYDIVPPRRYRDAESYRTIVTMPGFVDGEWQSARDHFDATWKGSELAQETIFLLPGLDDGMDLDPAPDWSQPNAYDMEGGRNAALFLPLSDLQASFRMDRTRVILDCGKESSAWGLRVASYFPSRFAALILRDPVDTGDLRLDSLTGLPVLLIRTNDPQNQAACEKIEGILNGFEPGSCTVIQAQDAYPFLGSQADIATWAEGQQRNLFRRKVVLAPNHDMFNDGYWVRIMEAEPMELMGADEKPKLVVEVDTNANRITVDAVSVGSFELMLNDALVNLDEEFTVVVNGQAIQEKRSRSLNTMADALFTSYDPTWIFTTTFRAAVPK